MSRLPTRFAISCLGWIAAAAACGPAGAQSFRVVSMEGLSCTSGNLRMNVIRSGLGGQTHTLRTQVLIGGVHYMNEGASISLDGSTQWALFDNVNDGSPPVRGTWPMPDHRSLQIRFTLERPYGWPLSDWLLILGSCNLGGIRYNGPAREVIFYGDFN